MLPRGLQLSQPFNRSCVRLPPTRFATTPSIAFSTSAISCRGKDERDRHEPESRPRPTESPKLVRRVGFQPKTNGAVVDWERYTDEKFESFKPRAGPWVQAQRLQSSLPRKEEDSPLRREEPEQQKQIPPFVPAPPLSPETRTVLPEIPELKPPPGTVRITRHLAAEPVEKQGVRRVVLDLGEQKARQLRARPGTRAVKGRKENFVGVRSGGSRSRSASAEQSEWPEWATSRSGNPKQNRRGTETGSEEAFPSASELQSWFKEFTSEQPNSEATTAQSAPPEPSKMRVKKTYRHDEVKSEEELRELEQTGFSGAIKTDPHRGTVFRQPKEELDTLVSSVDMPEKQADNQSNEDGGPAIVVLNGVSRSLLESDFRHLAGHGQHVDGWTYGLVKGTLRSQDFSLSTAASRVPWCDFSKLTSNPLTSCPIQIPNNTRTARLLLPLLRQRVQRPSLRRCFGTLAHQITPGFAKGMGRKKSK